MARWLYKLISKEIKISPNAALKYALSTIKTHRARLTTKSRCPVSQQTDSNCLPTAFVCFFLFEFVSSFFVASRSRSNSTSHTPSYTHTRFPPDLLPSPPSVALPFHTTVCYRTLWHYPIPHPSPAPLPAARRPSNKCVCIATRCVGWRRWLAGVTLRAVCLLPQGPHLAPLFLLFPPPTFPPTHRTFETFERETSRECWSGNDLLAADNGGRECTKQIKVWRRLYAGDGARVSG